MPACAVHHTLEGPPGAPVLVLSNSLGATAAMWEPQLPALTQRFRVLRYDTRGHGASPVPAGPYEIADLGGDVLALLDARGIERASFCGVSLGGMTALWLAQHAPERLDRIGVLCSSAHLPPASAWAERAAAVRAAGTVAVIADAVVGRWLTPAFAADHPDLRDALRATLASTSLDGYVACCGAIERLDLRAGLAGIRAPTLVVAGAEDLAIPPDHGERVAVGIPGARLEVLSPGAHLINVERADVVTDLIIEHFDPQEPA